MMDPIIYLIGALMLSLAIIYYGSALKAEKKPAYDMYMDINTGKLQSAHEIFLSEYKKDKEVLRAYLDETAEKTNVILDNLKEKIETAEFMAHSAKMDVAKGLPLRFAEPLKVYHYQRIVNRENKNKMENKSPGVNPKVFNKIKKQMESL